ncbi:MAG: hypothetical protein OEM46_05275, partial [Ignavibacteria bacterium]|nr:hypothetical protein [Ignavibacteria bacterium]
MAITKTITGDMILDATIKDFSNIDVEIEIYKSGYSGSSTEINFTHKLEKQYVGEDNEYKPIRQTKIIWQFSAEDQSTLDIIEDIFLQEEGTYVAIISVDSVEVFGGTCIVDEYREADEDFPIQCEIVINDLATLKTQDAETNYIRVPIIQWIATELQKAGFQIPIKTVNEYYPNGESQNDVDDSLATCTIDRSIFYNADDDETDNAYAALEYILRAFAIELFQKDGYWWLLQMPEMVNSSFRVRNYDFEGTYVNAESYDPELDFGTDIIPLGNNLKMLNQGYKKIKIEYNHGDISSNNIVPNAKFTQGFGSTLLGYNWEAVTGSPNVYRIIRNQDWVAIIAGVYNVETPFFNDIASNNIIGNGIVNDDGLITYVSGISTKFRFKFSFKIKTVNFGFLLWTQIKVKIGNNCLMSDGSWVAAPSANIIGLSSLGTYVLSTFEIETDAITEGGAIEIQLGIPTKMPGFDIIASGNPQYIEWYPLEIDVIQDDEGGGSSVVSRVFEVVSDLPTRETLDLGVSKIGTAITTQHRTAIVFNGTYDFDWVSATLDASGLPLNQLTLANMIRLLANPRLKYDHNFLNTMDLSNIFIRDSIRYRALEVTWDMIKDQSKATLMEIKDETPTAPIRQKIIAKNTIYNQNQPNFVQGIIIDEDQNILGVDGKVLLDTKNRTLGNSNAKVSTGGLFGAMLGTSLLTFLNEVVSVSDVSDELDIEVLSVDQFPDSASGSDYLYFCSMLVTPSAPATEIIALRCHYDSKDDDTDHFLTCTDWQYFEWSTETWTNVGSSKIVNYLTGAVFVESEGFGIFTLSYMTGYLMWKNGVIVHQNINAFYNKIDIEKNSQLRFWDTDNYII